MKKTNYCFRQQADNVHEIYLYDDVSRYGEFNWETWEYDESETSASHFAELLNQIPQTDKINMYFNCNGGDVDQGTAIYNLLTRHGAYKTGYVDGACHSIAFTIFQAMDKRIMGDGTSAIIHNMWCSCCGNSDDLRKCADNLDVFMESCIALFMKRAKGITEDELREMFKQETVLTPQMAVDYGFCDEIGETKAVDQSQQLQILTDENNQLKQKIKTDTEFQKKLVEFYQSIHQDTKQIVIPDAKEIVTPETKQLTGWGAFFNSKKKSEV